MRISTLQAFQLGLNGIRDVSDASVRTQQQISTGKRVLQPSDDPVVSSRILSLQDELASIEQYDRNITNVENRLKVEESQLGAVNEIITRTIELTIQAGNGSLNKIDRQSIAQELSIRLKELQDIMNSRDASGDYIFGGYRGANKPFIERDGGGYEYTGDEGQRIVQISQSTAIPTGDSGKSVFVDIESVNKTFYTRASSSNLSDPPATIDFGIITDQQAYDEFYPNDMVIQFDPVDPTRYSILDKNDGRVIRANQPYISGNLIDVNGVGVRISGVPAPGDSFSIESTSRQDLLTTVGRIVDGLNTIDDNATGRERLKTLIASSISNLQNAEINVLDVRSAVGGRLNTIDSTRSLLSEVEITTQGLLSDLQDLDYAEAVSRLSFETFILEAAQQSFVRVQNLSLFNFIG